MTKKGEVTRYKVAIVAGRVHVTPARVRPYLPNPAKMIDSSGKLYDVNSLFFDTNTALEYGRTVIAERYRRAKLTVERHASELKRFDAGEFEVTP